MLLVDVHKLDIVLANPVGRAVLEDQVDNIRRILRLEGKNVIALRSAEHLRKRAKVDTKGDVAVASEGAKSLRSEQHGDKSNVGIVHSLQRDTGVIAVKIAILDKILDGVDDLEIPLAEA